jgi:3-methyladenine DNA glycosylase AlkD
MTEQHQKNVLLSELITRVKALFEERRNDEIAKDMAKFMKEKFHFFGVNSPNQK